MGQSFLIFRYGGQKKSSFHSSISIQLSNSPVQFYDKPSTRRPAGSKTGNLAYKPQIYSERKRLLVDYEIARSFVERVALPGKQSSTYSCHDYIIVSPK